MNALSWLLVASFFCNVMCATYYVATNGSDSNPGSFSRPFLSVQQAAYSMVPGDTTYLFSGVHTAYQPNAPYGSFLYINASGSPSAWTTFAAYPGARAHVQCVTNNCIYVVNAAYIVIHGLEIEGLPYVQYSYYFSAIYATAWSHHINATNNTIYGCPGGGICSGNADYFFIYGNKVHDNAQLNPYAASGISLWQNINSDLKPGYHNVIKNNIVWNNYNGPTVPTITDGNCIIIDDGRNTQWNSPHGVYNGSTLVENNICFGNGGRGLHTYLSDHVDFVNNIVYQNQQASVDMNGEITALSCSNIRFYNNIVVPRYNYPANNNFGSVNVTYSNNLYYNTTNFPVVSAADFHGMDPLFLHASLDAAIADFRIATSSPAIKKGMNLAQPGSLYLPGDVDFNGIPRPTSGSWDLGAFQISPSPTTSSSTTTSTHSSTTSSPSSTTSSPASTTSPPSSTTSTRPSTTSSPLSTASASPSTTIGPTKSPNVPNSTSAVGTISETSTLVLFAVAQIFILLIALM